MPGAVGVAPAFGRQPGHRGDVETRDLAEVLGGRDREIDVAVHRVRRARLLEPDDQGGNLVDGLDRPDVPGRGQHPQGGHVVAEQLGVTFGDVDPVQTVAGGAFQQRVVDVGDVLHVLHVQAVVEPDPDEGVEGQVGGGMAEVRRVVRRNAADVEPGGAVRWLDQDEAVSGGVVDPKGGRRPGKARDACWGPGTHRWQPSETDPGPKQALW